MIILEEQTGLNAGLNKKLKIGSFIKRNIKSAKKDISIKNAIKIGKVAIPLATTAMSFIPGGGIAGKLLDSKAGKLFNKVKNSKVSKFATKIGKSRIGKLAINNVVKPTIKNAFAGNQAQPVYNNIQQMETSEPVEAMPNATPTPAQLDTIAQVKGVTAETLTTGTSTGEAVPNEAQIDTLSQVKDIPAQNLKEEALTQREIAKNETLSTDKPNYTIPIVIGVVAVGGILLATSSKSN
ncbi:hypothetical protein [Flavobacterium sp.]|uniref:hypothetical protein n=1 Tax=Flavobacterium sp. TaxID=239 RepID=UPI0037510B8F